jgi:predicted nucleic acid-binding protein
MTRADALVFVVDSSVAYKWFNADRESGVAEALALLRRHVEARALLAAPAHLPAEVFNGLRYSNLDHESISLAAEALDEIELVYFPVSASLLKCALDIAISHDLTINDALFPALAIQLNCELVTADRAHARVQECPVRLLR